MLSRQDYRDYLKQLYDLEVEMASAYKECISEATDEEVKQVCTALLQQEKSHGGLVEELMKLLEVSA